MGRLQLFSVIVSSILFFPYECRADAINPLFNLFTPDTVVPASILTALIITVESLLLWRWIKPISFRISLWRATIINIVSSAAGSIAAWMFLKDQMIWEMTSLYIPMFFLTLATETPALKFLYRRDGLKWGRIIKISFINNIISYLLVFIAQFGLIFAYIGYADHADKQIVIEWNDVSLLDGESGFIYTIKHSQTDKFKKYVFNRYDVKNRRWETIDPGFERGVHYGFWDIKKNIIACIIETDDWKNRHITILNADTFLKVTEIAGNFRDMRISPDLSKLAVLEYVGEIGAPRDAESDFMLGTACKLKIYDLETGALLYEAPRLALNIGLTWSNDSTKIIYSSLRNESLFQSIGKKTKGHTYGRSYANPGQFPIDLFIYDIETGLVNNLVEGHGAKFVSANGEIVFLRESGFFNRDLWRINIDNNSASLVYSDIRGHEIAVSPSGKKYLVFTPHKQPLSSSFYLTLIDPSNQDKKLIIEPNALYGFRWVQN